MEDKGVDKEEKMSYNSIDSEEQPTFKRHRNIVGVWTCDETSYEYKERGKKNEQRMEESRS